MKSLSQPAQYCALGNKYADQQRMKTVLGLDNGDAQLFHPNYFDNVYIKKLTCKSDNTLISDNEDEIMQSEQRESMESINEEEANVAIDDGGDDSDDDPLMPSFNSRWPSPLLESSLCRTSGRCVYYPMDAASLLPVKMLDLQPHHKVIDLCAAPGGKSLAIAQYLNLMNESRFPRDDSVSVESYGKLVCCDISPLRRARLKNVLRQYLPTAATYSLSVDFPQLFNINAPRVTPTTVFDKGILEFGIGSVHVVGGDYTNYTAIQSLSTVTPVGGFDRVLVDAPCSTERHLILTEYQSNNKSRGNKKKNGKAGLVGWGPGRSRRNAQRQIRLLQTALRLCKRGGRVVYSTCSLSGVENDDVIRKVINKFNRYYNSSVTGEDSLVVTPLPSYKLPFGEPTEFGWQVLPDTSGWGPIYLSVLTLDER